MKKLLFSLALLAGITFVSCSSDDDNDNLPNCVTCVDSSSDFPEIEICRDDYESNGAYQAVVNASEDAGYDCN